MNKEIQQLISRDNMFFPQLKGCGAASIKTLKDPQTLFSAVNMTSATIPSAADAQGRASQTAEQDIQKQFKESTA